MTAHSDGTVQIYTVERLELISTHKMHTGAVNCLIFNTDGKCLLTGGEDDKIVKVWQVQEDESNYLKPDASPTLEFQKHFGAIRGLAMVGRPSKSRSGRSPVPLAQQRVVLVGMDGMAYLWDIHTGNVLQEFPSVLPSTVRW